MATMSSRSARKILAERLIVERRNKEADFRNTWSKTAQFFHDATINTTQYNSWLSPCSFRKSMEAYRNQQELGQRIALLHLRRHKLANLICQENAEYEKELKELRCGSRSPIQAWKQAEFEHKILEKQRKEENIFKLTECVRSLMKKLEEKNREIDDLMEERGALINLRKSIQNLQRNCEQNKKYCEPSCIVLKNHTAFLRNKSRHIFKEMNYICCKMKELDELTAVVFPSLDTDKYSAKWMKQVTEDQMKIEREREKELRLLDKYEAASLWNIQGEKWEAELLQLDICLSKVFEYHYEMLESLLSTNKICHKNVISEREQLLLEIEKTSSELDASKVSS